MFDLETIFKLYYLFQVENVVISSTAILIVILCNLASCVYHRILANDESKRFLIINVLNDHLAFFYQFASLLYLTLFFCEIAEVEKNDVFKQLEDATIQIVRFYFVIKMAQMSVAISTKHYKPGW